MIDIKELRRLTQAVSGWSNCNQAWLDQSEDVPAAVVGHIDEDGNTYPVATIDCDQYYAARQSLPLAKFYAASNPAAITELLNRLEAAEKSDAESLAMYRKARDERDALRAALQHEADCVEAAKAEIKALRAKIAEMEEQGPVAWLHETRRDSDVVTDAVKHVWGKVAVGAMAAYSIPLYALPGAKGED